MPLTIKDNIKKNDYFTKSALEKPKKPPTLKEMIEKLEKEKKLGKNIGYPQLYAWPGLDSFAYAVVPDGEKWKIHGPVKVRRIDFFIDYDVNKKLEDRIRCRWWLMGYDFPVTDGDIFSQEKLAVAEKRKRNE